MKYKFILLTFLLTGLLASLQVVAQPAKSILVKVDQPAAPIQPTEWGIFFEDINLATDGGLYAEMVKNRSFEFYQPLMGWKILKSDTMTGVLIINQSVTNAANPR